MTRSFFPVRFAIGAAAAELLSTEFLSFYEWMGSMCSGEPCRVPRDLKLKTIPITNEETFSSPASIYLHLMTAVESFLTECQVLLVDLSGPFQGQYRGSLEVHLGQALISILNSHSEILKCVVLWLPELPPEGDSFRNAVGIYIETKRLVIVDRTGKVLGFAGLEERLSQQDFLAKRAQLRLDPGELLNYKMIRRVGHFRRDQEGRHHSCQRYFYDGRRCVGEVVDVLVRYIKSAFEDLESLVIVAWTPKSPWLYEAVLAVGVTLSLKILEPGGGVDSGDLSDKKILFVFDMVDSGVSVKKIWERFGGGRSDTDFKIFSILSTKSTNVLGAGLSKRLLGSLEIDYALLVEQHAWPKDNCPLCKLGVPFSRERDEEFDMLTSYDMWELNKEAGFKGEEDVPRNRPPLDSVPDYPRIIRGHGAWLAYKIGLSLESLKFGVDTIIVCPDEHAPQLLADYLQLILKANVIKIPRSVLDEVSDEFFDVNRFRDKWGGEEEFWYFQLESLPSGADVIILDEFHVSGGTYNALSKLVLSFGRNVSCYFPLIDFNPVQTSAIETRVVSLYSFQAI